jgi:hypothetical protein
MSMAAFCSERVDQAAADSPLIGLNPQGITMIDTNDTYSRSE